AMAVYFLVFQGCLAGGSLVWGCIAERSGMPCALIVSGALMLVTMMATGKVNLVSAEKLDMRSSRHWPQPNVLSEPHPDHGPVLITVEYLINPERAQDFRQALGELEAQRRRDGAVQWHLYCDLARNDRYCEMFMLESWGEYLRQRERATVSDRHAEEKVISFHVGGQPPQRFHMLAERRRG
ncbi:MAG TPA: MFS transporter, partial [Candidatus Obscuribacterales bacterium]